MTELRLKTSRNHSTLLAKAACVLDISALRGPCRDNGIGVDFGMRRYRHRPQYFGAGSNVDVAFQHRRAAAAAGSYRHLLEQQAVHADGGVRMNDYSIGVRHQEAAPDVAGQRDVCARRDAPEAVLQHVQPPS